MPSPRLWIVLLALGGCTSIATAEDQLRTACVEGDRASCDALAAAAEPAPEPRVTPARDPVLSDPSVAIGVSSDRGVGVGLGARVGSGVSIGLGLGL